MIKLKIIILVIFFPKIGYAQEIFEGLFSAKYVPYKSINEVNSCKISSQLILLSNNTYKLTTQTFINLRKINKKRVINCSTIEGHWKKKDNYLILISNGFNNLTTYMIKNKKEIFLVDDNFKIKKNIKLKKVEKIVELNCNERDEVPMNDLN